MSNITIYHNPACGTSRNTLEMIRNSGTEPTIIYYLETPPTRDELVKLIADMGISVRASVASDINKAHFSNNLWGGYRRFISGAYPLHQPLSARCAKRRILQGRWRESG